MKNRYTHLLIDLDHTLWDFDTNCRLTIEELHNEYQLQNIGIEVEHMYRNYLVINNKVWSDYDRDLMTKEQMRSFRFVKLLETFGVENQELATELEEKYLFRCPKKGHLLPNTLEFLDLVKKDFSIHLITNGFDDIQKEKVLFSGLGSYFENIYSSESTGYKKPNAQFFHYVLNDLNVQKQNCLVIGDNPHTDIAGANNVGLDSLWVNAQGFVKNLKSTYYVEDLRRAMGLFG
jgi:putative hydrolase of the HAD superfamily